MGDKLFNYHSILNRFLNKFTILHITKRRLNEKENFASRSENACNGL